MTENPKNFSIGIPDRTLSKVMMYDQTKEYTISTLNNKIKFHSFPNPRFKLPLLSHKRHVNL
jgi:hypothetical protein